jgi:hypothetical protein
MSFAGKWVKPEITRLNDISQAQKDKYHYILFTHLPELDLNNINMKTKIIVKGGLFFGGSVEGAGERG